MRKLTKKNLDELAEMMPRISEIEKMSIVGGGSGTKEDPYTIDEFDSMCDNDNWKGGFVVGQGYVAGQVTVVASGSSESSDGSGSNSGNWGDLFPGGNTTPSGYWNTPDSSGDLGSGNCSGGMWVNGVWVEDPNNNQTGNGTTGGGDSSSGVNNSSGSQNGLTDITNNNCIQFIMKGNEAFYKQLVALLSGNSQIKSLLVYFDRKYMGITFTIANFGEATIGAATINDPNNPYASIIMAFNSEYISSKGWIAIPTGEDNVGFKWDEVENEGEALVVIVTHEAIHANHYAKALDALAKFNGNAELAKDYLLENKYSQEFVNIYFVQIDGKWKFDDTKNAEVKAHKYMKKYDLGIMYNALDEYRKDK